MWFCWRGIKKEEKEKEKEKEKEAKRIESRRYAARQDELGKSATCFLIHFKAIGWWSI